MDRYFPGSAWIRLGAGELRRPAPFQGAAARAADLGRRGGGAPRRCRREEGRSELRAGAEDCRRHPLRRIRALSLPRSRRRRNVCASSSAWWRRAAPADRARKLRLPGRCRRSALSLPPRMRFSISKCASWKLQARSVEVAHVANPANAGEPASFEAGRPPRHGGRALGRLGRGCGARAATEDPRWCLPG